MSLFNENAKLSDAGGTIVTIGGNPQVGQVLTATLAEGYSATGYQWTRGGADIAGATAATYTLVSADAGKEVSCKVTGISYAAGGVSVPASVAPPVTAQVRVVSSGLRLPGALLTSQPKPFYLSGIKRKALTEIKGQITALIPTFYLWKPASNPVVESNYPDPFRFRVGIELSWMDAVTGRAASKKVLSNIGTYNPASPPSTGYIELNIDLGTDVIPEGAFYGIWTAMENTGTGPTFAIPYNAQANSKIAGNILNEYSVSRNLAEGGSFIDGTGVTIATLDSFATNNTNQNCFTPCAILANSTKRVWAIGGDSIPYGDYDQDKDLRGDSLGHKGYADRLFSTRLGLPSVNVSMGADRAAYVVMTSSTQEPTRPTYQYRKAILQRCQPDFFHTELGTNDLAGGRSYANIKADIATFVTMIKSVCPSIKTYGGTILPQATSTDSWVTVANQTATQPVQRVGAGSFRGLWNADVRANTAGFDGYIELANAVENDTSAQDSKWIANGTQYHSVFDGTHPSWNGAQIIASAAVIYDK